MLLKSRNWFFPNTFYANFKVSVLFIILFAYYAHEHLHMLLAMLLPSRRLTLIISCWKRKSELIYFIFKIFIFMLFKYVCVAVGICKGIYVPMEVRGIGVCLELDYRQLGCGCLLLNLGLLQEQYMLLKVKIYTAPMSLFWYDKYLYTSRQCVNIQGHFNYLSILVN